MPDLRQLRAFVAVAETLSFTRAAERLHLQQQTVSKTIRGLEAELAVELLERTTREVRLTPAGDALLRDGTAVLAAADAAFARAHQVGTGSLGRIRIGITPAIGITDREEIITALREPPGEVSLAFRDVRPADLPRAFREHALELALTRSLPPDTGHIHHARLRATPAVICALEDDPLARRATLGLVDLDGRRLLFPSPTGTPYTDMVLAVLTHAGVTVTPVEAHVTGGESILTELAGSDAVGLRAVGTGLPPGVVAIPIPELSLPLLLLWPAGLPTPAVHRLRSAMAPPPPAAGDRTFAVGSR